MDGARRLLYFWNMTMRHPLPRVNSAGLFRCAPDWSWDTGKNPFWDDDLWFVASGGGSLLAPVGMFELRRGSCFVLRGGQRYVAAHDPADPLTVYAVHFSGAAAPLGLHRVVSDPELVRLLLSRVIERRAERDEGGAALWMAACLEELRVQEAREFPRLQLPRSAGSRDSAGPDGEAALGRVRELAAALRDDPAAAPPVAALAASAGVSRQHFARLFKRALGCGPKEFIVRARIEAAMVLLKNSDHPVKRVAALCGYADEFLFSRAFKRIAGCPPGAFRRDKKS